MSEILTYFLENEPTYANTSPDFVAKDLYEKFGKAEGWSQEGYYEDVLEYKAPGFGGEFTKGFTRSMKELGTLATSGMAALAASGADKALAEIGIETGLDKTSEGYAKKAYDRLEELGRQYPMSVETRHEVEDLESALQYAGGLAGQGLGSTADMAATALITGALAATGAGAAAVPFGAAAVASGGVRIAGKEALKQAARKAGKELTEEMLEKQMGGVMGRAFSAGAKIGAVGGSVAAESGSSYLDLLREGHDVPGVAIAAGAIKGSLEILPEFAAMSRLFKSAPAAEAFKAAVTKETMKRYGLNVAGEIGKISGGEALTEAAQQAVDIAARDFVNGRATDLFSPENVDQLIEAGIAGAVGGAPIGVAAGTVQSLKPSQSASPIPQEKRSQATPDHPAEDVVDEVVPVGAVVDPDSPKYNSTVAADSSSVPPAVSDSKAKMQSAINTFNEATVNAEKARAVADKVAVAITGVSAFDPSDVTNEFNKEPRSSVVDKAPTDFKPVLVKKPRKPRAKKVDPTKPMKAPAAAVAAPALPKSLQGAKPKYGFGKSQYDIQFPSDFEKALYIAAPDSKGKSKADPRYVEWLKEVHGLNDKQIRDMSKQLKADLKKQADVASEDIYSLKVPSIDRSGIKTQRPTSRSVSAPNWSPMEEVGVLRSVSPEQASKEYVSRIIGDPSSNTRRIQSAGKGLYSDRGDVGSYKLIESLGDYYLTEKVSPSGDGIEFEPVAALKFNGDKVDHFVVRSDLQRRGLGQKLLQAATQDGKDVTNAPDRSEAFVGAVQKFLNNVYGDEIVSTKTSSPAKASAALTEIRNTLKDILGDNNVAVDFFDSINGITSDGKNVSLRGAQWANVIQVAVNPEVNPNARETALHEAFHFLYNNVLSQADRNRIENSRDALIKYINEQTGVPTYDLSLFDSEELGATAFGLWADTNKPVPAVHTAGRVLQKLKNILKSISKAFRRNGLKDVESLFQDIIQGNLAMPQIEEILDNERLIRTQAAVAKAKKKAQEYIVSDQASASPERTRKMLGAAALRPKLMEWTKWTDAMVRMFYTNMGLADKDHVFASIFTILQSKDRHLAVMDTRYASQMHDLFQNKTRLNSAGEVLDTLDSLEQPVKVDESGRIYYKKGDEIVYVRPDVSKDALTLHEGFRDVLEGWRDAVEDKIKQDGFDTIEQAIEHQEALLDASQGPDKIMSAAELTSAQHRLAKLKGVQSMVKAINTHLLGGKVYFPHLATGTHGITIRKKGKPGDPLPFGFAMVGEDLNGNANQKEIDAVVKRWADEYGYSGGDYVISGAFELNRKELKQALGDNGVSLNVLASLMSSADPALADEIQELMNGVREDNALLRLNSSFVERDNTLLYSKDYASVIPAYFASMSRSLNNFVYADSIKVINDVIDSGIIQTPQGKVKLNNRQKQFYREQVDYITKSSTDMATLRAFNFMFALGGNISTGILQLVTVPTAVAGVMNTYTGNPITNNALLMKNMAKVTAMMTEAKFDIGKLGDEAFLEKHFPDESMRNAIRGAYTSGVFRPKRLEDMSGRSTFTSGRPGSLGYVDWAREKGTKVLGMPIQIGEEISRISSFMSLYETLSDPKAFEAFENNFVADNARYAPFKEDNSHLAPAAYAALFALDETHGVHNKLGRGKNQQGIYGSVLFPFMGHPLMMMGLMNRLMHGNAVNKRAAAYIIMSTMLLAGMYGIPGWELWKETAEWMTKQISGKEVDLQHEFKAAMVELGGFSPAVAEGISEGALKPLLGVDIARRVGTPIFFQDLLIPLLQGRGGADVMSGVAGSQLRNVFTNWDKYASGESSLGDAVVDSVVPTAFRNMYKAVSVWPEEGIRTASGNQIMTPEEIDPSMIVKKAIGLQPSQVSREYERRAVERLQGTGWRFGYDRRINNLARTIHERNEMEADGKDVTAINENIAEQRRDIYAFAREAGKTIDREFANSVTESISRRLRNARNPDRPQRRYENVDYNILDVLYERE